MNEDKSTRYHRLRRRAQVGSILTAGVVLLVWALAGGPQLRTFANAVGATLSSQPTGQWFGSTAAAALILASSLEMVGLPAAFYLGFVLERRYGLSRQTARQWAVDHAKIAALALCMAVLLAWGAYGAIAVFGPWWWLVGGAGVTVLVSAIAALAPVLLLPLFFRLRPLTTGEIPERLVELASRAGTPVLGVYEWALGEKSSAANAALVGFGPTRRILLSDTLLQHYSADEIEVITAHEIAHHVHGDMWKGLLLEAGQATLALLAAHVTLVLVGTRLSVVGLDDLAGLPVLALAAGAFSVFTSPVLLAQSRSHERRADRFALELTRKADAFVSAMRRLGAQNLAEEVPRRAVGWLFHSHPSISDRISDARNWAAQETATRLSA